jgi:DNA-binding GntR family transcriptional regulator
MSAHDYEAPTLEELAGTARRSYRTVEEMACQVIRQGIVSGVFRPGEHLPQDAIAKALGVSRIPVRAALRQLEAEGFVTLEPHRGGTVKALSVDGVREVYDLRALLEVYALRVACAKITPGQITELEALEAEVEAAGDPNEWVDRRQAFYRRLYETAELPITTALIMKLRADVGRYWLMRKVAEDHDHSLRVIIDALKHGDAERAEVWLRQHLEAVSAELQRLIAAETGAAGDPNGGGRRDAGSMDA